MRPLGFRRDIRPLQDFAALGHWFASYTASKIFITLAGPALVWAGVAALIDGQIGGVLPLLVGTCWALGLAWGNYYRFPDPDRAGFVGQHE